MHTVNAGLSCSGSYWIEIVSIHWHLATGTATRWLPSFRPRETRKIIAMELTEACVGNICEKCRISMDATIDLKAE